MLRLDPQYRSDVTAILEREGRKYGWHRGQYPDTDDALNNNVRDLLAIDTWYSRGRYWAMARQHDANLALTIQVFESEATGARALLHRLASGTELPTVTLPDDLLPGLALLDGESYGEFTHRQRRLLARAWKYGQAKQVEMVLAALLPALEAKGPIESRMFEVLASLALVFGPTAAVMHDLGLGLASMATTAGAGAAAVGAWRGS